MPVLVLAFIGGFIALLFAGLSGAAVESYNRKMFSVFWALAVVVMLVSLWAVYYFACLEVTLWPI